MTTGRSKQGQEAFNFNDFYANFRDHVIALRVIASHKSKRPAVPQTDV